MTRRAETARPLWAAALVMALLLGACSQGGAGRDLESPQAAGSGQPGVLTLEGIESKGIRIESLRLSAAGYMVDLRYRVLQPDKAGELIHRHAKPYLIDQGSKRRLMTPAPPKIGALRQTAATLQAGRVYFALFANPGRLLKPGDKVTIVMGGVRIPDVPVE